VTSTARIEDLLRELAPQVLGAVVRRYGDFDAAEDAVQEALLAAAMHWPAEGLPDNPRGWLIQTAVRRLTDQYRSDQARRRREESAALRELPGAEPAQRDDPLVLLFMCCHPALTPASSIALTLRTVAGLSTAEIATAFLVPEATMAQRISRAKQKIKASGIPFRMPAPQEFEARLGSVLHVLYLLFNEGYTSSAGTDLHRTDLSGEAIRLTRTMHAMLPEHSEVTGLLALMLLNDARRPARTGAHGELIPLAEQDRTRWNRPAIAEGVRLPRPRADLRPAQPRLRPARRQPQPLRATGHAGSRSCPVAGHPGRRGHESRERPQLGDVAGRPGLPSRRRHPHRPPPSHSAPARPRAAQPRTLTHHQQ
jgi:RNA polymerase sigma factor (sigma-70 family)